MPDDGPQVSYSLKEVLSKIDEKLDLALKLIPLKADASDVNRIDSRLQVVEAFIAQTKITAADRDHKREWVIPVVIAAILAVFEVLQAFHL